MWNRENRKVYQRSNPRYPSDLTDTEWARVPADLDAHLVVDNYATHKHPKVRAWLILLKNSDVALDGDR